MAQAAEACVRSEVHRCLSRGTGSLRILVTGRTGTGKSALVNSIVGAYVATEGYSPFGQTTEVTMHKKEIQDVTITIYDSPGLQEEFHEPKIEDGYLKNLEEKCKEVDLNLYCIRMTEKMRPGDNHAIVKLSRAFGMDKFWQNTLFVLTFANEIKLPPNSDRSLHEHFKQRMLEWKGILHNALTKEAKISKDVAENVPVVPAGYSSEPFLPGTNSDYWLGPLWWQCLFRTEPDAKPILLQLNQDRLRTTKEAEMEDIQKKEGYKQLIVKDVDPESMQVIADIFQERIETHQLNLIKWKDEQEQTQRFSLKDKISHQWRDIGGLIGLSYGQLDNIQGEYHNAKECCRAVLGMWLENPPPEYPPTWQGLLELLKDSQLDQVATDLSDILHKTNLI